MTVIKMYHGKSKPITRFDYSLLNDEKINEEGAGFYLTSSVNDAKKYGNYVYHVQATYEKTVPTAGMVNVSEIEKMVRATPDKDELLNWGGTHKEGIANYLKNIPSSANFSTPYAAFTQVWYDFYRYYQTSYLKNMVGLGYDGVIIKSPYGVKNPYYHFIAFDPKKLKIIGTV